MLKKLQKTDPELIRLASGQGSILISNRLQGRIFAEIGGTLLHRFDAELAAHPDPVNFNNLGGNSLWPAPEGGDYAFNYPADGDWYVQPGINSVPAQTRHLEQGKAVIGKRFTLTNRRRKRIEVDWQRQITVLEAPELPVAAVRYGTAETIQLDRPAPVSEVLMSAWSLEQFPGADGIVAFGLCEKPGKSAVNTDFYGDPLPRLRWSKNWFRFELGGPERLQIGIDSASLPQLIGEFDAKRGVAVIRKTPLRPNGKYINFADNDQKNGPFSSSDMYSIFNGAQVLNFHELETLAPMTVNANGMLEGSRLESESTLLLGEPEKVREALIVNWGVPEEFLK